MSSDLVKKEAFLANEDELKEIKMKLNKLEITLFGVISEGASANNGSWKKNGLDFGKSEYLQSMFRPSHNGDIGRTI